MNDVGKAVSPTLPDYLVFSFADLGRSFVAFSRRVCS